MYVARYKVVKAGAGRNHTVVVTEDGNSLSFGWNKHGQLGSGSVKNGELNCLEFLLKVNAYVLCCIV